MVQQLPWMMIALAACSRLPAPREPDARVLFLDLERLVTVAETTGWSADALEIETILKGTLDSVCRVDPLARRELGEWLDGTIRRLGGPVEVAWRARGKKLSEVGDLLVLTRIRKLLARAEERAGDCPFWLEPEVPFHGRQVSEQSWQLMFGGGGKGIVVHQGDRYDLSAGGAGRLLIGRVLTGGHAAYTGLEVGASASFPKDDSGERTAITIGIDVVAPVVYRYTLTNAYVEIEGGWLGRASEQDWSAIDHGIHAGIAVGARALRTRFVFPGAAFGLSWERTFLDGDDATLFKFGARFTFDLDL
jgi:hemin uptake protein HemP